MVRELASERATPEGRPLAEAGAVSLRVQQAAMQYGSRYALHPLSLTIRPGERVAVVGPSGAGKSTLLRLLATALQPTEGSIEVLGRSVDGLSSRALRRLRARIGTVHQQLHLVAQASVMQNVISGRLGSLSLPRALAALVSRAEAERVAAVLDQVGIADRLHERVDRLSGGEQQRVAIARALYQDPEIVIADEPVASVDPARPEVPSISAQVPAASSGVTPRPGTWSFPLILTSTARSGGSARLTARSTSSRSTRVITSPLNTTTVSSISWPAYLTAPAVPSGAGSTTYEIFTPRPSPWPKTSSIRRGW